MLQLNVMLLRANYLLRVTVLTFSLAHRCRHSIRAFFQAHLQEKRTLLLATVEDVLR
jgi:hypothetical protein